MQVLRASKPINNLALSYLDNNKCAPIIYWYFRSWFHFYGT